MERNIYKIGKKLFITSDEEIKEGDWCHTIGTSLFNEQIGKVTKQVIADNGKYGVVFKKIILTTDVGLIKDGVQSIDDEFLEWFVKNSSCEFVKVQTMYFDKVFYKIIIPKEEQKQHLIDMMKQDEELGLHEETLEEGFDRILDCLDFVEFDFASFKLGAKWQQERRYSEEDMNQYSDYVLMCSAEKTFKLPLQPKEWFEQFKKKSL